MKFLSLDLGDRWIGTAISDELGLTCKPLQTVESQNIVKFLKEVINQQNIHKIIVGHPKTKKGTKSEQTLKAELQKIKIEKKLKSVGIKNVELILWDERLSSKRANEIQTKKINTVGKAQKSHSIAAAFILQSYLNHLAFLKNL